jgi:hypothetical protein
MNDARMGFKRIVVGLPQGLADRAAVEAAADLAEFLRIELLATFIADSSLHTLAALSGAREFRAFDQRWQAIDAAQITREIDRAAGLARQRFVESVGTRAIKTSFDVIGGAEVMASLIRADDIVAVIEPAHPGERITQQFTGLLETALATAGAVLAIPRRIARTAGPIVMIASDFGDPSIRTALQIAAAFKERLVVTTVANTRLPIELLADANRLGVAVEHVSSGALPVTRLQERMRVLTRSALTDKGIALFSSLQGIPLLLIDPDRAASATNPKPGEQPQTGVSSA